MKHDKDKTKTQMSLVPLAFVAAMAEVLAKGIKGERRRDDWKYLSFDPETTYSYEDALLRHLSNRDFVAVAVNAMILWWHSR